MMMTLWALVAIDKMMETQVLNTVRWALWALVPK